ncbi:MAG: threonine-phosphate decarboxylase CobD [Desulfuromonadaceae bacterium]
MSLSYDHGGNVFTVARALGVTASQILDFSASINPLGMSPQVRAALIHSLDTLVHYPDSSHAELKQTLADYHRLPAQNFTIANGSTELIYNLPAMVPGRKALIISPSFSEYVRALTQHGWEIEHFVLTPESGFAIDLARLEQTVAGGVDVLFLCNPGNPGGILYPQSVVEAVYRLCQSAGTFLVLDEAFMDFCEEGSAKQMIAGSDKAVILRSMTKFFAIPGLRLGYAICNEPLAERLGSMGGPWSVNTLALTAGVAALQDSAHNRRSLEFVQQERTALCELLKRFSQLKLYPSRANYLLIETMSGPTAREIKEKLMEHRIMIRDCTNFTGLTDRFFRIAVRTCEENTFLIENLGRMVA